MTYINYHTAPQPYAVRYFSDLVRYRHLAWNLVSSDLRSRFRRSSIGILWAMLQPLAYSLVIAWVWGAIFHSQTYWQFAVYVYSGMLVWEYFNTSLTGSVDVLMNAAGYLRQGRIPFLIFQLRVPLGGVVIFLIGVGGLLLLMLALGQFPTPGLHLLLIPAYCLVLLFMVAPITILFSVVGAQFRDFKYILTVGLQALFFLSPVMMERSFMSEGNLAVLQIINPLVPLLDLFRDPVLHGSLWDVTDLAIIGVWGSALWILTLIASGYSGRKLVFAI